MIGLILDGDGVIQNSIEVEALGDMGTFHAAPAYDGFVVGGPYAPPHVYTELERAQQEITDLQLSDMEQGQALTDLELMILEVRHV